MLKISTYKPSVSFHVCHTLSETEDFTTQFLSNEYKTRHLGPPGCFSKTNRTD